ncbi:MAG: 1-deoxy-D-xylulose-5-phosphate synthase [Acidobacteria bacterium]|nr:MAG: 1-deoxy-D-xylulose-5-phosphate synthase [Acidobacteriota bacterium]
MYPILSRFSSPGELKNMTENEVEQLAKEIRSFIIETVSHTGGHLASSLGVVEITLALHTVFDFSKDRIIWDVGHQAYAHKILTGRMKDFHTLRQSGGISGFPKISESPYDHFNTGHSSTSISAALGMSVSRDLAGQDHDVIAFIGDGSLTAGLAFEGMNQAGHLKKKMIVILNDNEMSISHNVGALSGYLNQILSGKLYNRMRGHVEVVLKSVPGIGNSFIKLAKSMEDTLKRLFVPGMLFEELGFHYAGPVDGHDYSKLVAALQKARKIDGPVLIHVKTVKGKGYKYAEKSPDKWHGASPFEISTGRNLGKPKKTPSYTAVFGETMVRMAKDNPKITAITAAMPSGTGLEDFGKEYPDRFFDVGIAEQHAVTFASGMAISGKKPFVAIYSTFLQRAYDQVIHDTCLMNLPVVFCLDRAGVVGADGETHHGLYDLSFLRPIPNLIIMAPADENALRHMLFTASRLSMPAALRYPRGNGEGFVPDDKLEEIPIGKSRTLREGEDAVVFAVGPMAWKAVRVANRLASEGISVKVVDARFVKPLDETAILNAAKNCGILITCEENVLAGGFGSAVLELLELNSMVAPVLRIGIPDAIVHHGTPTELLDELRLTEAHLFYRIRDFIAENRTIKIRKKKHGN